MIEYAKDAPDDLCLRVTATNRGPDPAELHLLPTVWFRNTWADRDEPRPSITGIGSGEARLEHPRLGAWSLLVDDAATGLFCDNETNRAVIFGEDGGAPHPKDAINDAVVAGRSDAVNPAHVGTKFAAWRRADRRAGRDHDRSAPTP